MNDQNEVRKGASSSELKRKTVFNFIFFFLQQNLWGYFFRVFLSFFPPQDWASKVIEIHILLYEVAGGLHPNGAHATCLLLAPSEIKARSILCSTGCE